MYTSVFILISCAVLKGISDEIPLSPFKSLIFLSHISVVEKIVWLYQYSIVMSITGQFVGGQVSNLAPFTQPSILGSILERHLARDSG